MALKELGIEDERAEKLARLARRSLLTMRRQLALKGEMHQPVWAKPPVNRATRGLLLAGRWRENNDADRSALEALSGLSYDDFDEMLNGLAEQADPLTGRTDATWSLTSAYDAWQLLARRLRPDDLARLDTLIKDVLGETDPALELPATERWRAQMDGKIFSHSADLRQGLATTLALLGNFGEETDAGSGVNGTSHCAIAVSKLLSPANSDATGRMWISLSGVLPLLAEASPDAFLTAVTRGVEGETPLLACLFTDRGDGGWSPLDSHSPHTGLLWALETIAWSASHLGITADLLARLAEIDPGGTQSNRPIDSLAAIFNPWHPDTTADSPRRLAVLDAMRKRHPEQAWVLMLTMVPTPASATHRPSNEPVFRPWKTKIGSYSA